MDNIWTHILILIPLEFGLLHATPLGAMMIGGFHHLFDALGMQFAHAAGHAAGHVCEAACELAP